MSANHSSPEDGNQYDVNPLDHEDPSDENNSPLASHGNVDVQETSISSNSLILFKHSLYDAHLFCSFSMLFLCF
jgi:hypothetical protein